VKAVLCFVGVGGLTYDQRCRYELTHDRPVEVISVLDNLGDRFADDNDVLAQDDQSQERHALSGSELESIQVTYIYDETSYLNEMRSLERDNPPPA
jgi:hypothetical protein